MGTDDTVRLKRPAAPARKLALPARGRGLALFGGAFLGLAALAGAAWLLLAPPRLPAPLPSPPAQKAPAGPRLLSEAEIAALAPTVAEVVRLRENPRVFVLLFPDLDSQGAALNRLAALIEKADLPRDRLLNDTELSAAIARGGDTAATWFYGHDYRGADAERFFALASRDGIALSRPELWVRDQLRAARALVPREQEIALVSAASPDGRMDPAMRATVLRHEVSHGHFFTLPDVAAHVVRAWRERFSEADRATLRAFLGREGYDTSNEELMANEAMAYLLFTPDARIFSARLLGVSEPELARLRALMSQGLPVP